MAQEVTTRFPWDPPAVKTTDEIVAAMQLDMKYMMTHTAIIVHSTQPGLQTLVNTKRGQIIPRGTCTFTDGSTMEFQDIGMPQIGAPEMTVQELVTRTWNVARELGLELQT